MSEHAFGQSYRWSAMEKYVEQTLAEDGAHQTSSLGAKSADDKKSSTEGFLDGKKDPRHPKARGRLFTAAEVHTQCTLRPGSRLISFLSQSCTIRHLADLCGTQP